MSFAYIAPPPAPPVHSALWTRSRHEWIGWDGTTFEISDWKSGVFLTQAGIEGLGMPAETPWVRQGSPFVHGQTYTGGVTNPRKVFWPLHLYADGGSEAWQELDAQFWRTLHPGRFGTWRVTTSAGARELRCRFVSDGGQQFTRDPHFFGWQGYGIELVADEPFWTPTAPVQQEWAQEPPVQFYGGGPTEVEPPKASPFVISSGSALNTATMDNPGDVEAWVLWTVEGPASNVQLGVGDRFISFPGEIPVGSALTINSDPMDQLAYLDGADVTADLGSYDFAPIPAGGQNSLQLAMDGLGSVRASLLPRYYRAW